MINQVLVDKYSKLLTKEDCEILIQWTVYASVPLERLLALQRKLKPVETPSSLTVYRGVGHNLNYQDKMGIFEKKFFGHSLRSGVGIGHEFTYSTPRPLSFTDDINLAKSFGSVVVSATFTDKNKYIRITESLWEAVNKIEAATLFQEIILLDVNTPITLQVVRK